MVLSKPELIDALRNQVVDRSLVNQVLAGFAACRTQLFCYLKSSGRHELNTMNLPAGSGLS